MIRIKSIIEDVINGCTANNAREDKMTFNIGYYVNHSVGSGKKNYCYVQRVTDLEANLYNIIRDNISKDHDVVIADITIKHLGQIIKVNKRSYAYSLSGVMQSLLG